MRQLIKEIRQQPEHIRHVFMWVMVVITFSVVGFIWFRGTQKRFVALLNPESIQEPRALAQKTKSKNFSPFATIGNSLKDLSANIFELIGGKSSGLNIVNSTEQNREILPPQKLPLSPDK